MRSKFARPDRVRGETRSDIARLHDLGSNQADLPWVNLEEIRDLMGHDFWAYGLEANRVELEALTQWSFEERLAGRRLEPSELSTQARSGESSAAYGSTGSRGDRPASTARTF